MSSLPRLGENVNQFEMVWGRGWGSTRTLDSPNDAVAVKDKGVYHAQQLLDALKTVTLTSMARHLHECPSKPQLRQVSEAWLLNTIVLNTDYPGANRVSNSNWTAK